MSGCDLIIIFGVVLLAVWLVVVTVGSSWFWFVPIFAILCILAGLVVRVERGKGGR